MSVMTVEQLMKKLEKIQDKKQEVWVGDYPL